jgi:hypothetical protein
MIAHDPCVFIDLFDWPVLAPNMLEPLENVRSPSAKSGYPAFLP